MKFLLVLDVLFALKLGQATASRTSNPLNAVRRGLDHADGCSFTFSSSGSFACPAGQLDDGQIRLNGSETTATFKLQKGGGFIDAKGYGCIVTPPPTTQIQCDQGVPPDTGFSIDGGNNLLYHGSPNFWACPATDTEWNIYVNPDFGQTKCVAVTLKTDGCGADDCGAPSPTCPPPSLSTIWQTQTQWVTKNQTVTSITTISCSAESTAYPTTTPWPQNSTVCHHCTESTSLATFSTF
ncbi:hypothetical protein GGR52DRAFT_535896 [Hypoxylon sp. FL1284]|nr:hypothetical protein GGR52DRAFT_535896 [Hypoxylon sp. FL1284]